MKCVVCDSKTKIIDVRPTNTYFTTVRQYECVKCLTRFKTSEKILFDSIPSHIRNNFLSTGRRKINE